MILIYLQDLVDCQDQVLTQKICNSGLNIWQFLGQQKSRSRASPCYFMKLLPKYLQAVVPFDSNGSKPEVWQFVDIFTIILVSKFAD